MKTAKRFLLALLAFALASAPSVCRADTTLALNTSFVKKYKDKATLNTSLRVDQHPATPHGISQGGEDGDIHMAGRDSVVKLPLVAEIINAAMMKAAVQQLQQTSGSQAIPVTGVWRVWFEHPPGSGNQVQGQTVPVPTSSNPDHVFEIHPITNFNGVDVLPSFQEIKNSSKSYQAYPASKSFDNYEKLQATIKATKTAILITSSKVGYNYTEFVIELAGKPKDMGDSLMVLANVFDSGDLETPVTSRPHRMVFVKGTPAADELLKHSKGDTLHLLGIPRVNLSEVLAIASKNGTNTVQSVPLPYEMIVAAVLP